MKVLVTGGAGYIGSVLVDHLLSGDHEVVVVDSFMYGQTPLSHLCYDPALTIIRGDARDMRIIGPLVDLSDAVVPLAAIVGAPACASDRAGTATINVEAVRDTVRLMRPDQKLIFPNTNSGYGRGDPFAACTEDSQLEPISLYGRQKVQAEEEVLEAHPAAHVLRLATVFGMSQRMRLDLLVNDFVWRAVNDRFVVLFEPRFKRNYIHVMDVAEVIKKCIEGEVPSGVYNVGLSDANLSKVELCDRIKKHVPDFVYMTNEFAKDPDQRDYVVSNAKLEATGWCPLWDLDFGIAELVRGFAQFRRPHTNV